ncbi:MAG: CoA pyrophosphatase [Qingshengfaniella sp.]
MSDTAGALGRAIARVGRPSSDFDLNPQVRLPEGRKLRAAAVLVGVTPGGTGPQVLLTKRSSRLRHHPGQIAFPGGKCDPGDPSHEAAALREAHEEIGLPPAAVQVIGRLPRHETVTGFDVVPVVAWIDVDFTARPEAGEVDEVFRVPLSHLLCEDNYRVEARLWGGQRRRYYAVPFGPYYIWGATARILRALADRMAP